MSRTPQLETAANIDPIIGPDFSTFSPSRSRVGTPVGGVHSPLRLSSSRDNTPSEQQPLLGGFKPVKKPFYRARPLWLVPFVVVAALVRGMTLAPRVEVFTQLSCSALHRNYNHTAERPSDYANIYSSLDSHGPTPLPHNHYIYFPFLNEPFPDEEETDPRNLPSAQCLSDPAVQAGAARMQTTITTTMGLLSALTTGWWGHFSERHGRTTVLALSTLGLMLTDLMFILVSTPHTPFSGHSHRLLYLGPIVEGILGGWSTLNSTCLAYISDCTSPGSRAHIFSRFIGVLYIGFSIGPVIGGYLIRHPIFSSMFSTSESSTHRPSQNVTSVFWIAIICSCLNLLLVLFVLPESLSKEKRANAMFLYNGSGKGKARASSDESSNEVRPEGTREEDGETSKRSTGVIANLLSPLKVFVPSTEWDSQGRKKKDWSLTLLGGTTFFYMLACGIFQIKYLYAEHVYGWGAEQLSYYISFIGGARAAWLLLVLPFIISTFKPKPKATTIPPLHQKHKSLAKLTLPLPLDKSKLAKQQPNRAHLAREISFDLNLTRLSLCVDILSQVLVVIAPAPMSTKHHVNSLSSSFGGSMTDYSQAIFVGVTSLSSVGAGTPPAIQSLALCILQARALAKALVKKSAPEEVDTGKLFGALAVLQAIGQMIIGPMLFGLIYSSTVAHYPKTIFSVAGGILVASLTCILLVRAPHDETATKQVNVGKSAKTAGKRKGKVIEESTRGRSRTSKDLRRESVGEAIAGPSGSGSMLK